MTTTTKMSVTSSKSKTEENTGAARKLLSFGLGKEEYGLDILAVREIIGVIDITPLPRTPPHVKGVINLRGKIIPVLELRARFGLPSVPYTEETCIIVIDVPTEGAGDGESRLMGVVVDTVREVLDIPTSAIEPTPAFGGETATDYITGIGKVKEKVVVILDATRVMTPEEAGALGAALQGAGHGSKPELAHAA